MNIVSRLSSAVRKRDWGAAALETGIVALGILMALAVDAWWEERKALQAEQLLLQRLRADFELIQHNLVVVSSDHLATREAALMLLNLPANEPVPQTQEADIAVALVFLAVRTFNPGTGVVSSLMAGEGAQLIRDKSLADMLLAWSGLVEELQEEELSMQKAASERWTPYLAGKINLGPYYAAFGEVHDDLPQTLAVPQGRLPLSVDQEFLNHVMERYKWQQLALRDLAPVQRAVEDILAHLDREIRD